MSLVAGTRFGAFEVLERLGAGGMGEVYRARDTRLDRTVALKIIRASDLPGRDRVERFKREARAISRVNHPNICALYDIGEDRDEMFLVMEYVGGGTLASRLERGALRIEETLRYGVQMADALDTAHRNEEMPGSSGAVGGSAAVRALLAVMPPVGGTGGDVDRHRREDPGRKMPDRRARNGIPIDRTTWASLVEAAERYKRVVPAVRPTTDAEAVP